MLSNILFLRLTPYVDGIAGLVTVDFDIAYQPLLIR